MTNDQLLARFEAEHMAANSVTPQRRGEQLALLRGFAEQVLDGRPLTTMEPADVMRYLGAEVEAGKHPNTMRTRHGMLRAFQSWALTAGLMTEEQRTRLRAVPHPRGSSAQSTPKPYSAIEIKRFYSDLVMMYPVPPVTGKGSRKLRRYEQGKCPINRGIWRYARRYQYEAQVSLALEEGLRCIEICNLTLPQMHPDNDGVIVVTAKQGPGTKREREVPFTAHSRAVIAEWLEFRALLGVTHDSPWVRLFRPNHLDAETLDQMHHGISLSKHVWHWHRFRHTYATERLRAGMPIEQLRVTMGHGSIEQTLAYARILASDVQRESERTESAFAERLGLVA